MDEANHQMKDEDSAPYYAVDAGPFIDERSGEKLTLGEIVSDRVTRGIGSWRFIGIYFVLLILWMAVNTVAWVRHWDPYPFIFLNLVLSFQGAFAAPIILMSQNRQEDRDRLAEQFDHAVNLKAEREIAAMQGSIESVTRRYEHDLAELLREQRLLLTRIDVLLAAWERDRRAEPTPP